jgi:predicted Zn-dependent protease
MNIEWPKQLKVLVVIFGVLTVIGCTSLNNPLGPESEVAAGSDIQTADQAPDTNETIAIIEDDFEWQGAEGLGKTASPYGPMYKWHYRNQIKPRQAGKLYWCLDPKYRCRDGITDKAIVKKAFAEWQPYVPFVFTETANPATANIVIKFINDKTFKDHSGNNKPWYVGGMILGYAWAPYENSRGLGFDFWGDVYINDFYIKWTASNYCTIQVNGKNYRSDANLRGVLTHELGHALGLGHSSDPRAIMYATASATQTVHDDDIKSVTKVYDMPYQMVYGKQFADKTVRDAFKKILNRQPTSTELSAYSSKLAFNRLPSKRTYDYRCFLAQVASSTAAWNRAGKKSKVFVTNTFIALLNRRPNSSELTTWSTRLDNKTYSRASFTRTIVYGTAWAKGYVRWVYKSQLGASPSSTALTSYSTVIAKGTKKPFEVLWSIVRSESYFVKSSPRTNTGLVNRVYTTLLSTRPSSSQLRSWVSWID